MWEARCRVQGKEGRDHHHRREENPVREEYNLDVKRIAQERADGCDKGQGEVSTKLDTHPGTPGVWPSKEITTSTGVSRKK